MTRESGEDGTFLVSGGMAFADGTTATFAESECAGYGGGDTVFENRPHAVRSVSEHALGTCTMPTADGGQLILWFDEGELTLHEYAAGADPEVDPPLQFGVGFGGTDRLDATIDMFTVDGDDITPAGDATVSAALKEGPPRTRVVRYPWGRERIQRRAVTLTGTIELPDGRTFAISGCDALREITDVQVNPRNAKRASRRG